MLLASRRLERETAGTILNQQPASRSCVNPASTGGCAASKAGSPPAETIAAPSEARLPADFFVQRKNRLTPAPTIEALCAAQNQRYLDRKSHYA
jgi:hypothetical protein